MRQVQNILEEILIKSRELKPFRDEKLTEADFEAVRLIREELTKLAGPEDIISVKIINKNILDMARRYMLELIKHGYSQNVSMGVIQENFDLSIDVILDLWNECVRQPESIRIKKPLQVMDDLSIKSLKKHIILSTESIDETDKLLNTIDKQLINNKDYLNDNIKISGNDHELHVYIFKECENIPEIILKMSSK